MKKLIVILLLPVTIFGAVFRFEWYETTGVPGVNLDVNLGMYYTMNEYGTRVDSGPQSQNLTDNNTTPGDSFGKVNASGRFDASASQYLSHVDSTQVSVGDQDFSMVAWVYPTDLGVNHVVMSHWNQAGTQKGWRLWFNGTTGKWAFTVSNDGTATTEVGATTFGTPTINNWYFLYAAHDAVNNTISISVNNGAANTLSYSLGVHDSTGQFIVGARQTADFFTGFIDEVGFWKKVLSSTEVTYLYNSGAGRTCCPWFP